ncbi:MAG: hypothetical protein JNM17_41010 [Archangium sp.]|nr:hypothetical protein [Archangium sp.]
MPGGYTAIEPMLAVVSAPTGINELNGEIDRDLMRKHGLMGGPNFILKHATEGRVPPAYAYAFNNPLHYIHPDGRGPKDVALINCEIKCGLPIDEAYQYCLGDVSGGDKGNKKPRTKADCDAARSKGIKQCNSKCQKENPGVLEDWSDACGGKK